jgi:2-polyprenyl-3-methyl-5-hydroxy-6-metoxy-1,4-benzoquinol methylase
VIETMRHPRQRCTLARRNPAGSMNTYSENKADQEYWNQEHAGFKFHIARKKDFIRNWIESHIPPAANERRTCLEIGCYPGRFLPVFGNLGYELYGVDLADNLAALVAWLSASGCRTGMFWKQDFTTFDPQQTFDVVSSFGFVEHFTNWQDILGKHADLVAPGGYLALEAPNFVGKFQHWLHSGFDQQNYARHYIPAMDIDAWERILKQRGFDIVYKGYFGRFRFWTEKQPRTVYQSLVLFGLGLVRPLLKWVLPRDRKAYSPFCGVIAVRRTGVGR